MRDKAFYMVQLCFFRSQAYSGVQLYKSIDNGRTWTPGRQSALAASNFDYSTGNADPSIFNDNNQVVVDNNLSSPQYGRIYVTHIKFHPCLVAIIAPCRCRTRAAWRPSKDGVTWSNQDISSVPWNPNLSFFHSGASIGDYLGIDSSTTHIYPAWADGRTTQIRRTGIGSTDIFTNIESVP